VTTAAVKYPTGVSVATEAWVQSCATNPGFRIEARERRVLSVSDETPQVFARPRNDARSAA
jgi:hypothetical protein